MRTIVAAIPAMGARMDPTQSQSGDDLIARVNWQGKIGF